MSAMPTIDITDTKETDPVAKAKMIEANKMLKANNNMAKFDMEDLVDPAK